VKPDPEKSDPEKSRAIKKIEREDEK